ncbi:hypothetical protein K883_01368 [Mycobacterium sp. TKK-01-0059]|uniref:hypothetical protein n=1 Tax=Mycobacterium sp. TKK-01-0059 TaxID=1324269 RepID=UPI0004D8B113|nr:hypothetical protein [Mycobacterium sp. TKK-01-0059]KEF98365.1 hypothetical protein K883_01368 [Mycobacterium sp. TKK-01-0059]
MTYDERLLKADHVNLKDGFTSDADGRILSVREDTKIPLKPFNPLDAPEEILLPEDLQDLNDDLPPNEHALAEWRAHKQR